MEVFEIGAWCFVQTAVDLSRQVDGRCLVSILPLPPLSVPASSVTSSLAALARLTGCPQNHFTEP
ncbi:hypothetical protein CK196_002128, partial [Neisseria gonorrhoeae]